MPGKKMDGRRDSSSMDRSLPCILKVQDVTVKKNDVSTNLFHIDE